MNYGTTLYAILFTFHSLITAVFTVTLLTAC